MAPQKRDLPPLNTLMIFEAAARLGSLSRAGAELGLTQSAVSRQILKLEDFIGTKMFRRTPTGVTLTPTGELYVLEVQNLLGELARVTSGLRGWSGPQQVTIACSNAIADLWILPRLKRLKEAMPDLELRLKVTNDADHLRPGEFDLALFYRRERPANMAAIALSPEEIVPVAAPGHRSLGEEGATLLAIEGAQREWLGWSDWFAASGEPVPASVRHWRLGSYALVVEAAMQGVGITLGWTWLLRDQLASGRLVPAHDFRLRSEGGFYLMRPTDRHFRRVTRQVMDWLVASNAS